MSQKIDKLRGEIASKQAELSAAIEAGRPPELTGALVRAQIADLAESYQRKVRNLAGVCLTARTENDVTLSAAVGFYPGAVGEFALGMLAAHLGDKLLADLQAEIKLLAPGLPEPMDDAERTARIAQLRRELRVLEREEESLIEAEEMRGNAIERRVDADPVAVLGIPDEIAKEHGL